MTAAHEQRAHAILGASSAHRWMACPGSIRLAVNQPSRSSRYADEGTAAHQLAERVLRAIDRGFDPDVAFDPTTAVNYVGTVETVRNQAWEVTEEMAEAVEVFVNTVCGEIRLDDRLVVEQRFDLSEIHEGMFGTNDACVLSPSRKTLFVFDYKHGKGHAVEAKGNPQLRYYGLGALLNLGGDMGVSDVVLTIVQPRAPHKDGPIRSETISAFELLEWTGDLKAAAVATEAPDAPVVAGDHCTFCPAAGVCPALHDRALEACLADFKGVGIELPVKPDTLDKDELARVLDAADLIDDWLSAVRAHALHLAESGIPIPGYKLVPKRATRKWREDAEANIAHIGLNVKLDDLFTEPKLKSPAQVEKLLRKDQRPLLDAWVVKESSGTNLVPDSDARAAKAPSVQTDFASFVSSEGHLT